MRLSILAVAAALSACAGRDASDQVPAIGGMCARILAAHRDRDPAAWTALEADAVGGADRCRILVTLRVAP